MTVSERPPLPPLLFPCEARGCRGRVWITDQGKLGYHIATGNTPKGVGLCEACEAKVRTVTVPCLNTDTGEPGDRGCIGDRRIRIYDQSPSAAYWYVKAGCHDRPRMYPYCDRCRDGVIFTASCRNRGCRGDGKVRCTGDQKQGLLFLLEKTGETTFWPPLNCQHCKEFIDHLRDRALTCSCCKQAWRWSQGQQIALVRNECRNAFVEPELCDACLALGDDERKTLRRRANGEERQRVVRRELRKTSRSADGRESLRKMSRDRFLEAARALFRAPDRHGIDDRVKMAALTRVARLGGDAATTKLCKALDAVGTDAGRIAAMLANAAITDNQARNLTRALAKLAEDGQFPKAFAQRLKVSGGLRMSTGLAGTASTAPRIAQAAAYEIYATAMIADNSTFPYPFSKGDIASFHYRFQHNRYGSASSKGTYEGDIVIQHKGLLSGSPTTFVDFKHSMTGRPSVARDELERIFDGLSRGEIDRAVIVSNGPLASTALIAEFNKRIESINHQFNEKIPPIQTFVQRWHHEY